MFTIVNGSRLHNLSYQNCDCCDVDDESYPHNPLYSLVYRAVKVVTVDPGPL